MPKSQFLNVANMSFNAIRKKNSHKNSELTINQSRLMPKCSLLALLDNCVCILKILWPPGKFFRLLGKFSGFFVVC